jgi:hypothetical protein
VYSFPSLFFLVKITRIKYQEPGFLKKALKKIKNAHVARAYKLCLKRKLQAHDSADFESMLALSFGG